MAPHIYLWIASLLLIFSFFIHTFIGDKEIRTLRSKLGIDQTLIEKWIMSRCGWHWVSLDLILVAVTLIYIIIGEWNSFYPIILQGIAIYFFLIGLIWLFIVFISEQLRKKYIILGQWLLVWVIALLILTASLGYGAIKVDSDLKSIVQEYYQVYKQRNDFERFLEFYDEEIVLEDLVGGFRTEGKEEFKAFFNWPDPRFKLLDSVTMVIHHQVIEGKNVVTSGFFTPFEWDSQKIEAMQFTTILEFNDSNKIIKHIDWIIYPDYLLSHDSRNNSNLWLPVNKVKSRDE